MTRSRSVDSWLLSPSPPIPAEDNGLGWTEGEARLWWAVIRQSAKDVLNLRESMAMDAAEYLRYSGSHLVEALFGIPTEETNKELARLIVRSRGLRKYSRGFRIS